MRWTQSAGSVQVTAYRAFRQAVGAVEDELMAVAAGAVDPTAAGTGWREQQEIERKRRRTIEQLIQDLRRAAEAHAHLLAGSGLTADDWIKVTKEVFEHAVGRRQQAWRPSAALLDRLTPSARRLVLAMASPEREEDRAIRHLSLPSDP